MRRQFTMILTVMVMAALTGAVSVAYLAARVPFAHAACDVESMRSIQSEYPEDSATANYLDQEIRACEGEDLDKSRDGLSGQPSGNPDPEEVGSEPAPEPTATVTVTAAPGAGPEEGPAEEAEEPRKWEYLANRAPITKSSHNAFGPMMGMAIDKSLDDRSITAEEALTELSHRLEIDPMLTAATGVAFELWGYDKVDEKTKLFAENHDKWDEANAKINATLDDPAKSIKIVELNGLYTASWAIPGSTPAVRDDASIWRAGQLALSINGKLFQIQCGFQEYWKQEKKGKPASPKGSKPMPEPSPGMDRTPEGTPTPKPKPEPTPDKPSESPTPKPSPSPSPSESPSPKPSPTPSEKPSPKPSPSPSPSESPSPKPSPTPSEKPSPKPSPSPSPSPSPKSSNSEDYVHETGAPIAEVTEPAQESPDPVVTEATGGGGVTDSPTNDPGSETGVVAPGASPAPTATWAPPSPAEGANTPDPSGASECAPPPGMSSC